MIRSAGNCLLQTASCNSLQLHVDDDSYSFAAVVGGDVDVDVDGDDNDGGDGDGEKNSTNINLQKTHKNIKTKQVTGIYIWNVQNIVSADVDGDGDGDGVGGVDGGDVKISRSSGDQCCHVGRSASLACNTQRSLPSSLPMMMIIRLSSSSSSWSWLAFHFIWFLFPELGFVSTNARTNYGKSFRCFGKRSDGRSARVLNHY